MLNTEPVFNCPIGNVTFEPGCRTFWHKHTGGQILLVLAGEGLYQERGKPARRIKKATSFRLLRTSSTGTAPAPSIP